MKKVFLLLFIGMMMFGLVSAAEWDNTKTYDKDLKKITIKNSLSLGDTIAEITLDTPLVYNVEPGYQRVAEFTINNIDSYTDALSKMQFYDLTNEENEVNKSFDYKYKVLRQIEIPLYKTTCETESDHSIDSNCTTKLNGKKNEWVYEWENLLSKDLIKGQTVTIGVFTDVKLGDSYEWIPTYYGVRIDEFAVWTSELNQSLTSYYQLNTTSGSVIDEMGNNTGTNFSVTRGVEGKINDAFNFTGSSYVSITQMGGFGESLETENVSFSLWYNTNDTTVCYGFGVVNTGNQQIANGFNRNSAEGDAQGNLFMAVRDISGTFLSGGVNTDLGYNDGLWHHFVFRYQGADALLSVVLDNVTQPFTYANQNTLGTMGNLTHDFVFGARNVRGAVSGNCIGAYDEVAIYNRYLDNASVSLLFEAPPFGGAGAPPDNPPVITNPLPVNDTNFTVTSVNFNATVSDDLNLVNVSLRLDGSIVQTNSTGLNNSIYLFTETGLANGQHSWSILAFDNSSQSTESENRTFNITALAPTVTLQSPIDNFNSTTALQTFIGFVSSPETLVNVSLKVNSTVFLTNSSGINNSNYTFSFSLVEGTHTWSIEACDTDNDCGSDTRTITIDSSVPAVTITSPGPIINYSRIFTNIQLNWTAQDDNLDACWFTYQDVNTTVTCSANNTAINITNVSATSLIFYANDTLGNENKTTHTWDYKIFELNQTFANASVEGQLEVFRANVVVGGGITITAATLNYPGNPQAGSVVADGTNTTIFIEDFVVPGVTGPTINSFNWSLLLSDSSTIFLTTFNQTVTDLGLDNCGVFSNQILNFTVVDEETQIKLVNPLIEIDVDLLTSDRASNLINLSQSTNSTNPVTICLEDAIPVGVSFSLDVVVKYSDVNHSVEYYNIVAATLDSTFSENTTLFDLLLEDNTDFLLTFKDSSFVVVEGALINVNRQYISEGVFKTVELPLTDSNGQTVVHLVESDIVYNFIVIKDGVIIGLFNNLRAFCDDATIGSCFISLNAQTGNVQPFDYDESIGLASSFVYNETLRVLTYTFVTTDSTVKTINLIVNKSDQIGNTSICDDIVISSAGSFTCNIPASIGNSTIFANVNVDGTTTITKFFRSGSDVLLGFNGLFLLLFMLLSFAMMFTESKAMVIIGVMLGFGSASLLYFQNGGILSTSISGATSSFIWLAISGGILLWKLNKEGQT